MSIPSVCPVQDSIVLVYYYQKKKGRRHYSCDVGKCSSQLSRLITTAPQRQLRYIEWKGEKNYDFQKVTFSTHFKLYIAGLGVLIPKKNYDF